MRESLSGLTPGGFLLFLRRYKKPLLLSLLFVYACYASALAFPSMQIDEETWLANQNARFAEDFWIRQGRFGLAAFNALFSPTGAFNALFYDLSGIALCFAASLITLYCVRPDGKLPGLGVFAFCAFFAAYPLSAGELLSFSMFSLQQGLAHVFWALALYCAVKCCRAKKPVYFAGSCALLFLAVSFYQAYAPGFVTGLLLASFFTLYGRTGAGLREAASLLLIGALAAGCAVLLYFLTDAALMRYRGLTGGYFTTGYAGYAAGGGANALFGSLMDAVRMAFGVYSPKSVPGGIIFIAFIACAFAYCVGKPKKYAAALIINAALIALSPFFMNIALGTRVMVGRSLMGYAPALAGSSLFISLFANARSGVAAKLAKAAVIAVLAVNLIWMNTLYYWGFLSFEYDKKTAREISERISAAGYDTQIMPVVFIGELSGALATPFPNNPTTASFFTWDGGDNRRIRNFMQTQGYVSPQYSPAQFSAALSASNNLAAWPSENCVTAADGAIVFKLSEPAPAWVLINQRGN